MKKIWIYVVVILIALAAATLFIVQQQLHAQTMTFYYGTECPHCDRVIKFFQENQTATKIKFEQKEVFHNKDNLYELVEHYQQCKKNAQYVAVPFLWTGKTCILGDQNIIDYFKKLEHQHAKQNTTT